jgi:hypothetical protein
MPQPAVTQKQTPEKPPEKPPVVPEPAPPPVKAPAAVLPVDSRDDSAQPGPDPAEDPPEPKRDEKAVSSTQATSDRKPPKLVRSAPKVANSTACQLAPVLLAPAHNPQISQAVRDAVNAYQLRLCKGERLILKRNAQDAVLSPLSIPASLKTRPSFNMSGFLLRVQGSLSSVHDESLKLIVVGS